MTETTAWVQFLKVMRTVHPEKRRCKAQNVVIFAKAVVTGSDLADLDEDLFESLSPNNSNAHKPIQHPYLDYFLSLLMNGFNRRGGISNYLHVEIKMKIKLKFA